MAHNTVAMLTDKQGKIIPQIYDPASDSYKPLTTDVYSEVKVKNLTAELEGLKADIKELKQKTARSYVRKSTETKPNGDEGDSLVEIDTGKVYLHDGTNWSEF